MNGAKQYQRAPWTEEENARLRELWASDLKMEVLAERFPGRKQYTVYEHARRVLLLPARHIKQPVDLMYNWQKVLKVLEKGPATVKAISIITGIRQSTITGLLNSRRGKTVYISSYDRQKTRQFPVRVWSLGTGQEPRKPAALTAYERKKKYNARLAKEEPERLEMWANKIRVRKAAKAGKLAKPDEAAAWMMK